MKRFLIFFLPLLLSGIFCLTVVGAGEKQSPWAPLYETKTITEIAQLDQHPQKTLTKEENTDIPPLYSNPDWLKRTTVGAIIESDQKLRYYIETVQPFYQSAGKKDTVFTHIRISEQDAYGTYSAGVGYRRLLFNNNLMAGINTFFDYQDPNQHYQQGVGLEAIGTFAELRANGYFGLSPARKVAEPGTYEQARDGFDVEFGVPVPYLPWMKVFGSCYWYDFKKGPDMEGWRSRAEIKPLSFMTLNLETYDDNKGPQEWRADVRVTLWVESFAPKDIFAALASSFKTVLPEVDMRERTLDRVERQFKVVVEKWSDGGGTGGFSVQVGRT